MASFQEILERQASDAERPKPIPAGTYSAVVSGPGEFGESSKKKTPFIEFPLKIIAAGDDVDQDELDAWAKRKDGSSRSLQETVVKNTLYLTEDAEWRLTAFFEHCGLETEGKSHRQLIDECPGCQVTIVMKHEPTQDGEGVFAKLASTAKAD